MKNLLDSKYEAEKIDGLKRAIGVLLIHYYSYNIKIIIIGKKKKKKTFFNNNICLDFYNIYF